MNKSELVAAVAEKGKLTKKYAEDALEALIATIEETVAKGEVVRVTGFGSFALKERAARTGRNPQTGKPINIPASKSLKFTASKK